MYSMSLILPGLASAVSSQSDRRRAYYPATLLKIATGTSIGWKSSRRLERECQRNIELIWLISLLLPGFKTVADFGKDNRIPGRDGRRKRVERGGKATVKNNRWFMF